VAALGPLTVQPGAGSLALNGFAPTTGAPAGVTVQVPAGALTLSGYAPIVTGLTVSVAVPSGALTLTGYAPTVLLAEPAPRIFLDPPTGTPRFIGPGADAANSRLLVVPAEGTARIFKD
jgi:hypothetical protein